MRKLLLPLLLMLPVIFTGCVTGPTNIVTGMLTGVTSLSYQDAPIALFYTDEEVIRDQSQVATLIILNAYGTAINGVTVKEREGAFNPELRVSQSANDAAYIIDLLPGTYDLTVTYNAMSPAGNNPDMKPSADIGNANISGSYSGPPLIDWIRTSETKHTLKGGEIYVIGLKMLTISGEMDIYPLEADERNAIVTTRNKAEF